MKRILYYLLPLISCLTFVLLPAMAQNTIIPRPAQVEEGSGVLTIKAAEAQRWAAATTMDIPATKHLDADIDETLRGKCGDEGYELAVTPKGVRLRAATSQGLFYGMQSLRQLLPNNFVIGASSTKKVQIPAVTICDNPRFEYRGFMLDVSRHFHPVSEIKRILDLMAYYKMNVFHWHLTDDDGWRAEIKKYPRLTTVGAQSDSCRMNDMERGLYYEKNYGPYFYTQDEMRDVVRYAAERGISVVPEVDMPGHFCAAMAAYPEFSCNPDGPHAVIDGHGGIYEDVLNVANPRAVQFAKDVVSELCDIFPYPYFHIGGDECPTAAWERNADCQKMIADLGLTNPRQLQQRFIQEINEVLRAKGKRLYVWNECITEEGADIELMKSMQPVVFSWAPSRKAARLASSLQMPTIVSDIHSADGSYYINRRPSADEGEPAGAGRGDDTVEKTYTYVPVPADIPAEQAKYYIGVQATFWCEWVSDSKYLEYLAFPKLMCVAEAGWTPESLKDWQDFRRRMILDTQLLEAWGYNYSKHWMK